VATQISGAEEAADGDRSGKKAKQIKNPIAVVTKKLRAGFITKGLAWVPEVDVFSKTPESYHFGIPVSCQ